MSVALLYSSFALHVTTKRVSKFFDKFDITMSSTINRDNCDKDKLGESNKIQFNTRAKEEKILSFSQ